MSNPCSIPECDPNAPKTPTVVYKYYFTVLQNIPPSKTYPTPRLTTEIAFKIEKTLLAQVTPTQTLHPSSGLDPISASSMWGDGRTGDKKGMEKAETVTSFVYFPTLPGADLGAVLTDVDSGKSFGKNFIFRTQHLVPTISYSHTQKDSLPPLPIAAYLKKQTKMQWPFSKARWAGRQAS